jgi:hypothetical protein
VTLSLGALAGWLGKVPGLAFTVLEGRRQRQTTHARDRVADIETYLRVTFEHRDALRFPLELWEQGIQLSASDAKSLRQRGGLCVMDVEGRYGRAARAAAHSIADPALSELVDASTFANGELGHTLLLVQADEFRGERRVDELQAESRAADERVAGRLRALQV